MCEKCATDPRFERAAGVLLWARYLATFGTPLELWSLAARLVVARSRVGSPLCHVDARWALVVSNRPAGEGASVEFPGGLVAVPAGCALVVECLTVGGDSAFYPLCLVEPFNWSIGEGDTWASADTVAARLASEVLPALLAAVLQAEAVAA